MRFLSVDPLAADYAAWSGYNYVLGNPLRFVDPDGRSVVNIIIVGSDGSQVQWTNGGDLIDLKNGGYYKGNDIFICEAANDLLLLYHSGDIEIKSRIVTLDDSPRTHFVQEAEHGRAYNLPYEAGPSGIGGYNAERNIPTGSSTLYSPSNSLSEDGGGTPEATLTHELLGHGYDIDRGQNGKEESKLTSYNVEKCEVKAVQIENRTNKFMGEPARTNYGPNGTLPIPVKDQQLKNR